LSHSGCLNASPLSSVDFRFCFAYCSPFQRIGHARSTGNAAAAARMKEQVMDEKALFMQFWNKEAAATRKVLSRIPENSNYRPDPKSRTAREIAWLIVREEVVLSEGLQKGVLEWAEVPAPATAKEVLAAYDQHHAAATQALNALPASGWERKVPFMYQGQEVMSDTGYANAWGFFFDIIHHRGQLTTYLRPMGSTVPQIYGPSADEPM
jgi:uncharacterized damage-inducible protein DinB